jgi:hypothetical protein
MGLVHDPAVVDRDIHEQLVELHVLLREGMHQIVEGHAGDGQHGYLVELGVVQPVEQVDATWPGGRHADSQSTGKFGVAARHQRGGLLVANVDEADVVAAFAQRLDNSVNPVAR